ncbi:MAG: chemotaxis-specific protein-glutamate methyltransferase CheB [Lachnospiraceae bacterium]|nr:chemotaxis-specific protein-glutamate methyltransferase CheB [Lachnospiraceae bacterium]
MKKKILIVDDSALMRRVLCDIINSDSRFEVVEYAIDGADGFKKICAKAYDAVVLDVYMPKMTGLEMLEEMQKSKVYANVLMASTTTGEGAKETIRALDLGAVDFIKKPENVADARHDEFKKRFLDLLDVVTKANRNYMARAGAHLASDTAHKGTTFVSRYDVNFHTDKPGAATGSRAGDTAAGRTEKPGEGRASVSRFGTGSTRSSLPFAGRPEGPAASESHPRVPGKKIVAIASSTGGPKALQEVIPRLPGNLKAPVLLVQHMPKGFTASLASRLNELSDVEVTEARDGETIANGHVYIAPGGAHLKASKSAGAMKLHLTDEPSREGVKPCANYMYESLVGCGYDEVVCVVLTGMGADGTAGIVNLKKSQKIHVIAQNEESCTVYGMPRSIVEGRLADEVVPLTQVAEQIIKNVGVC